MTTGSPARQSLMAAWEGHPTRRVFRRTLESIAVFQQQMVTWCVAAGLTAWAASASAGLEEDFQALAAAEWGQSDTAARSIERAVVAATGDEAARKDFETRLAQLITGTASRPAKCFACQKLALIGTKDCVPALAGLLTDGELSHMARWALEAIPDPAAVAALRDALPKVNGAVKVGVINSLGVRRDEQSVAILAAALGDSDNRVVAAAAAALAKIGAADAVRALFDFRTRAPATIRDGLSVACVEAAENLARSGEKGEAARRFEELLAPTEPPWIQLAAFRGLIAAEPEKAYDRVITALQGDDAERRAAAGETIGTLQDPRRWARFGRPLRCSSSAFSVGEGTRRGTTPLSRR